MAVFILRLSYFFYSFAFFESTQLVDYVAYVCIFLTNVFFQTKKLMEFRVSGIIFDLRMSHCFKFTSIFFKNPFSLSYWRFRVCNHMRLPLIFSRRNLSSKIGTSRKKYLPFETGKTYVKLKIVYRFDGIPVKTFFKLYIFFIKENSIKMMSNLLTLFTFLNRSVR